MALWELVDCRIGSLENDEDKETVEKNVDCRIGSLETKGIPFSISLDVDCRIGSLEKFSACELTAV